MFTWEASAMPVQPFVISQSQFFAEIPLLETLCVGSLNCLENMSMIAG